MTTPFADVRCPFDGPKVNRTWFPFESGFASNIGATVADGKATITPTTEGEGQGWIFGPGSAISERRDQPGSFVGQHVFIEAESHTGAQAALDTYLYIHDPAFANYFGAEYYDGSTLAAFDQDFNDLWSSAWDPDTDGRYWGWFHDAGNIEFRTSADGTSWTTRYSGTAPGWMASDVFVDFGGYAYSGGGYTSGSIIIRGVNAGTISRSPATFFVLAAGDDEDDGLSPETAWQTIARVNEAFANCEFVPGDTIRFEAEAVFDGPLLIKQEFPPSNPLTIQSTSLGVAFGIDAADGDGIVGADVGGVEILDVALVGSGTATNEGNGVNFYNSGAIQRHEHLRFARISAHGFGGFDQQADFDESTPGVYAGNGLRVGVALNDAYNFGFEDVDFVDILVHTCADKGLFVAGWNDPSGDHANANINGRRIHVHHIEGAAGASGFTGHGLLLTDVDGGLIEDILAHHCGEVNGDLNCGAWMTMCTGVTFSRGASWSNRTTTTLDGGGFDIDAGCEDCLIEFMYSRDNDGAGFMHFNGHGGVTPPRDYHRNNTYRFCISENDGRANGYHSLYIGRAEGASDLEDPIMHNVTAYRDDAASGALLHIRQAPGARILNNIFYAAGGALLCHVDETLDDLQLEGNCWYASGAFRMAYGWPGYTEVSTLAAFRSATGLEDGTGTDADPMLENPGGGPASMAFADLGVEPLAYRILPGSPAPTAGIDLEGVVDLPATDFHGTEIAA